MIVSILNKRWRLRFVPNLGNRGDCDSPEQPKKEIRIWQGLKDQELAEVICHEALHASHWPLSEEYVAKFSEDLARILWKLGYRRTE